MEAMTVALGVLAAGLHLNGFRLYIRQIGVGSSQPNVATWGVLFFLMTLNAISYFQMSADLVKSLQVFAGAAGCSLVFIYSFRRGKFAKPNSREVKIIILGGMSIFVWWWLRSATYANLLIQGIVFFSFWPTFQGVWYDPWKESPIAWRFFEAAFFTSFIVVCMRYSGQLQDFAYPFVGSSISIIILVLIRKSRREKHDQLL